MPKAMTPNQFSFRVLNWLLENAGKKLDAERWAALLGIEIIDFDGWRKHDVAEEIDLTTFLHRVAQSTINPLP